MKVGDQILFGRNYDWRIGSGLLMLNKKGLSKTALILRGDDAPARWVSRFGSLTFNQYGRELPMGGINEAGLVIELMWLAGTRYPTPDKRPAVQELAWIQYQLDTARGVDEVLASESKLRIQTSGAPIHFLVCDRAGKVAAIEFLGGKAVVHRGDELPFAALANSPYAQSLSYLKRCEGFGGERPVGRSKSAVDRFSRAARGIRSYVGKPGKAAIKHAFSILKDVSQGRGTQWSIVYDLENMRVHFRTAESPALKVLNLAKCDFTTGTPCQVLDIHTEKPGDIGARFVDYTTEINRKQIYHSWKNTEFLKGTPDAVLDRVAEYPSTIKPAKKKRVGERVGK